MPRIALYSHDTMGLGHIRRNLQLAQAIAGARPDTAVLLISGTHLGGAFRMPPRVDCLTLPALVKHEQTGAYGPRHLPVSIGDLVSLRARTVRSALESFEPDVLVVDNVPLGALGEMEPALASLGMSGRTRVALGLRDVLDEPRVITREWARAGHHEAIARYYDQVWIYGDPAVYDVARECGFPESTRARVRWVGYLDRRAVAEPADLALLSEVRGAFTLCMAGGGQDGGEVARAFAGAAFPRGEHGVLLTGPFMPEGVQDEVKALARARGDLHVIDFADNPAALVSRASRVVGMAGYNSVCEILTYRKPALLVPREHPRREQAIRAERFRVLGLVDVLPTHQLTSARLSAWVKGKTSVAVGPWPRLTATHRVTRLVEELLGPTAPSAWPATERTAHAH
ncbi:MAG: glycosyltransferase [Acidobacteriota bacterium]|nr:glycosyltransferase [Acidobacteriota bacterium]